MVFSKETILQKIQEGKITITPFDETLLKGASYTLRIGEDLEIPPKGFLLGKSLEKITLSSEVVCMVFTKPGIAQQGIDMAQSAPFCQPDTDNLITFEIANHTDNIMKLEKGTLVGTAVFMEVI